VFYGETVVDDDEVGRGRAEVLGVVVGASDGESLGEASGAGGEELCRFGRGERNAPEGCHGFDTADGFEGAEENASCFSGGLATDVGAVMIAVDEVDVSVAGRSEKNRVAGGESVVGVGSGIGEAEVGFDLDDASGE